ncbi:hypothetical protein BIV57_02010 [Mangrovactinospora gilvigrisea]|uniref:Uncharacterized protein n=1 Tax=Mangrovactinospora gilvigrisea TaxID=1428644 RepID=A0A1J7C076_9ACTN|nr:hypothetical protein [Mangrovactinospora gilvigrisea]OIV39129.1 hypothetical protein BIV57_02010 [Mangrovactinospora gilvigrisea]
MTPHPQLQPGQLYAHHRDHGPLRPALLISPDLWQRNGGTGTYHPADEGAEPSPGDYDTHVSSRTGLLTITPRKEITGASLTDPASETVDTLFRTLAHAAVLLLEVRHLAAKDPEHFTRDLELMLPPPLQLDLLPPMALPCTWQHHQGHNWPASTVTTPAEDADELSAFAPRSGIVFQPMVVEVSAPRHPWGPQAPKLLLVRHPSDPDQWALATAGPGHSWMKRAWTGTGWMRTEGNYAGWWWGTVKQATDLAIQLIRAPRALMEHLPRPSTDPA